MAAVKKEERLYEKRRKRRRKIKLILCLIFCILLMMLLTGVLIGRKTGILGNPVVKSLDISEIRSTYGSLMQVRGGKVIGEKDGDVIAFPASLTKIMTTIVAIENLPDLNHEITITDEMVNDLYLYDATQAGFQPGETVRAIDLLYGVMLPSGADC